MTCIRLPLVCSAALLVACGRGDDDRLDLDAATQRVLDELVQDDGDIVVLAQPQPLRAGETIETYAPATAQSMIATLELDEDSWFFWIDDVPSGEFSHPSRLVAVGRDSGEITVVDASWWPVRDGLPMWSDDAYWSGDDWVFASPGLTAPMPRRALLDDDRPVLDCTAPGGAAIVIDEWKPEENGERNFTVGSANMNDAFELAGLDTTHFGPAGAETVDAPADFEKLDEWFRAKAKELKPGDPLVVFLNGHGWVNEDDSHFKPGEASIGDVYETDLERWLALFDPGVNVVVVINGCYSGAMLDSLSCVADAAYSATNAELPSYGDVDDADDPNPNDSGSEWVSSLTVPLFDILTTPSEITRIKDKAASSGSNFFRVLIAECFEEARKYDAAYINGRTEPQARAGAAKTTPPQADPGAPMCDGIPDPPPPTGCSDAGLDEIGKVLGAMLGDDVAAQACTDAKPQPAGNTTLHSNGVDTSTAAGPVDIVLTGTHLGAGIDLSLFPCGVGELATTYCAGNDAIDGDAVVLFADFADALPMQPALYYQYGFVFDSDGDSSNDYVPIPQYPADFFTGSNRWYQFGGGPVGWTLSVDDVVGNAPVPATSNARLITTDSGLVLVLPASELDVADAAWRLSAFEHDGSYGNGGPWSGDLVPTVAQGLAPLQ